MKNITPILKSLGLLESEVKTYLSASENGAGTALDISKATKLSRQAVYVAIDGLTERGLMSSILHGKKRLYIAEHPKKLLAYAKRHETDVRQQITDLEQLLPELELQMGGEKPVVRAFEGKEGILGIVEDIKSTDFNESFEITDLTAMDTVLKTEDLIGLQSAFKKRGVHFHGLYAGRVGPSRPEAERYILPKEFEGFKSNLGVNGDKIVMVTFEGKMHSVIIENSLLAQTLRILFELALRAAKKENFSKK